MNEPITIYWSPAQFSTEGQQWNLLYSEPSSVADNLILNQTGDSQIVRCPATRNTLRNIFSVHAPLDDEIDLSNLDLETIGNDTSDEPYSLPVSSRISLTRIRQSSYSGFVNVGYNLGWLLFASEPLTVRVSAPFFPTYSPCEGSLLATGEFDIGQWFRPINLDYHIPITTDRFVVKENQPLAYLDFQTDKKISFQRYKLTPYLENIYREMIESPNRYGKRKTLADRYRMAKRAGLPDLVLSEIRQNLVE